MPNSKTKTTTTTKKTTPVNELVELRLKLSEINLNIQAGLEKNTNAGRGIKKQIAQLLTKQNNK